MVPSAIRSLLRAAIFLFGIWQVGTAQQCNTLLSFNGSAISFTSCVALPTQNAMLAWTFHEKNSSLELAFVGNAPTSSGWVGWGINPFAAAQMVGSSALVAFQSAQNGSNVLPYNLTQQVQLLQVPLTCTPVDLAIQTTAVEIQGTSMRFFVVLQLQPNQTILHHVWNRGSSVVGFQPQEHGLTAEDLLGYQTIDMSKGQISEAVPPEAGPPQESLNTADGVINTIPWRILLLSSAIFALYFQ